MLVSLCSFAQEQAFKTTLHNKENDLFMNINLYQDNVIVPGQEILGETYGYLKKNSDSRVWLITAVTFSKDGKKAVLEMINDYGSEDLIAELTILKDGRFRLKQTEGSSIKVASNGKWVKIPKEVIFTKPQKP